MVILISEIPEEGLEIETEESFGTEDAELDGPIKAALRVTKHGPEVVVAGTVEAVALLKCGRCLRGFRKEIEVHPALTYHPLEELKGAEKNELFSDELETGFYEGDDLDIGELVKEQVILSIPMKPLCMESCRGICPGCGTDLNEGRCTCGGRGPDPRWETLKKFLDKGKE